MLETKMINNSFGTIWNFPSVISVPNRIIDHEGIARNAFKWAALVDNVLSNMCAQLKLKSACASAQSDQSLCCPHEKKIASSTIQNAPSDDSDQTARMRRLIWIFTGRIL